MSHPWLLKGMPVMESPAIPEFKQVHKEDRKWARRVMWQRERRFNIKMERVVILLDGAMHMHPNTAKVLKEAIHGGAEAVRKKYEFSTTEEPLFHACSW